MAVVGWVPVPNASPGSSRITRLAPAGGWCQLGTIQSSGVMATGANCACVSRTQSCSGTAVMPATWQWSKKPCAAKTRAASSASISLANRALMPECCQPIRAGAIPGSPNSGCSMAVEASASSTLTLCASSASSASDTVSTCSCGHCRLNSNIQAPGQRLCWLNHSSR